MMNICKDCKYFRITDLKNMRGMCDIGGLGDFGLGDVRLPDSPACEAWQAKCKESGV